VAICVEVSGSNDGALVGTSFFNRPGRKKEAGETLCEALIPLQPVNANGNAVSKVSHRKIQFNLTCRV
jgi:hypothetical protein